MKNGSVEGVELNRVAGMREFGLRVGFGEGRRLRREKGQFTGQCSMMFTYCQLIFCCSNGTVRRSNSFLG
jgi:hypothetical protein